MRGVAIYFSREFDWVFLQEQRDLLGRWIWVQVSLNGQLLNLISYYGPITDDVLALSTLYKFLIGVPGQIVFGGDFDYIQDLKMDTSSRAKKTTET